MTPHLTDADRAGPRVHIEPYSADDLPLLRLHNSPEMTEHLGGPEPEDALPGRHRRYLELPGTGDGRMFRVVLLPDAAPVGLIGYWEREWRGETVCEAGWGVLPPYQRRGIAAAALAALVDAVRAEERHPYLHAFPSVDNRGSNGVCRRLGFTRLGTVEFEYPPGTLMRSGEWRLALR